MVTMIIHLKDGGEKSYNLKKEEAVKFKYAVEHVIADSFSIQNDIIKSEDIKSIEIL